MTVSNKVRPVTVRIRVSGPESRELWKEFRNVLRQMNRIRRKEGKAEFGYLLEEQKETAAEEAAAGREKSEPDVAGNGLYIIEP